MSRRSPFTVKSLLFEPMVAVRVTSLSSVRGESVPPAAMTLSSEEVQLT